MLEWVMLIYFFIIGLIVGSFLNSVIYRLEQKKSFLKGRSFCPNCQDQLAWPDLIPVFSFLILGGKCRYCQQKISWQYPLVELATGIIFLSLSLINSNIYAMAYLLLVSCFLIIIFVYDLKHYLIPDKIVYPAIAVALIFNYYSILSAFGAASFFFLIVLISRGQWMGRGDIKLAFLMGLFLGWPKIIVAIFLAVFLGAIIGIGLIISGKKTLKSEVPFGPFLVTGTFLALFWGGKIINFYFNLFQ